jgi:histidine kinase
MSIRFRLVISYLTMILVSIIFIICSTFLLALLFRGDLKEIKNIYLPPEHKHEISKSDKLFINLRIQTLKNPGEFSNQAYLKKISNQVKIEDEAGGQATDLEDKENQMFYNYRKHEYANVREFI